MVTPGKMPTATMAFLPPNHPPIEKLATPGATADPTPAPLRPDLSLPEPNQSSHIDQDHRTCYDKGDSQESGKSA